MSRTLAVARREYASLFRIPLGWIVMALFLFLTGFTFRMTLRPGEPASLRGFFDLTWLLLAVICPAISMRLFSEEIRNGTIEPLLTSPITEASLVVGKFMGAVFFLATLLLPTVAYVIVLMALSNPDPGPMLAGYLGVFLLGMFYLSIGTLASALTASQPLAFLGTLFAFVLAKILAAVLSPLTDEPLRSILYSLGFDVRIHDFARGLIDTGHIVFFVAASGWFLAVAAIVLESRRWR